MADSPAVAWIALAILAVIVEVSVPHFGIIFLGAGALIAAAAAGAERGGGVVQVVTFAGATALSLVLLRPRLLSRLEAKGVPSRTEALIGREGVVTLDIEASIGAGRVNVGGEDWAARSASPLKAGTRIRVVAADGIVLEVTPP
jgi:membrane-bound serine protease (ClpP class)